jgi:hypothetical protein
MAALVPAIRASNTDVGGVLGDQTGAEVGAHGSRNGDGVSMIDGLRIGNMYISSNLTNMSLSPLLFDQVDIQLSGQAGETGTNGVIMNAIPKAGGKPLQRIGARQRIGSEPPGAATSRRPSGPRRHRRRVEAEDALRHQRRGRVVRSSATRCGSTPPHATSPTSTTWRRSTTR